MARLSDLYRENKLKGFMLVLSFLVVLSLSIAALADKDMDGRVISVVKTAGNISVSSTKIISKIRSREGMLFDSRAAAEDAKRIAGFEGVEYAYYNARIVNDKVELTFVVVEKNLVRKIYFNGNHRVKSGVLLKKIDVKKGDYLDEFSVRAGIDKLLEYYHKKGYAFAEVSYDSSAVKAGSVIYNISEGPRAKLKKVFFAGNKVIQDKEIKRGLESKSRKWVVIQGYYSAKAAEADVAKIETAYQKRGFLNAKVSAEPKFFKNNTQAHLTFNIIEGSVYIVDSIEIAGNTAIETAVLSDGMKLQRDWFYSEDRAEYDAKKILEAYQEIGYINAAVKKTRSFVKGNRVQVVFDIDQGEQFRIGKIDIVGNMQTQDKVIRRVLDEDDFQPGQLYNANIAKGSGQGNLEKDVKRATYAKSAFITPVGDKPGQKDALVTIDEGKTGMIMFGAGIGSDDGVIGQLVYEQRNFDISDRPDSMRDFLKGDCFKGAGQKLRIALEPGTEVSRYSVSFTEPYLRDKPIQLDVTISNYERERDCYDEERMKGYVSFTKRFKNGWYRGLAFRLESVKVGSIDSDAPVEIKDVKGSNILAGIKLFTGKSTVDSRYNPTKGYIFDIGYEQVGGGDTFGVISATNRWYKTLHEDLAERKTVLETKIYGAAIVGNAPPFEKFYAGGTGSIRGFEYRGVSTRGKSTAPGSNEKEDPIGSDWIVTANTELVVPLGYGDTVSALFFADGGIIDTGGVRASVGIGVQIMIPQWFGPVPMRFEIAAPMMKADGDETQVFSFSVGRLF